MKNKHDGDCSIYASLDNYGMPEAGICTCGYGHQLIFQGDFSQIYLKDLEDKLIQLQKRRNTMTVVIVTTQFEGIHCWPECSIPAVQFLKTPHRHMFHVRVEINVNHDDRDVEFVVAKHIITKWLNDHWPSGELGSKSCEMIAKDLLMSGLFNFRSVEVMEDGENGAKITMEGMPL